MDIVSIIKSIDPLTLVVILILISIIKGFALWKAARRKEKTWFWCLLLLNTAGVLPIIYLVIKNGER